MLCNGNFEENMDLSHIYLAVTAGKTQNKNSIFKIRHGQINDNSCHKSRFSIKNFVFYNNFQFSLAWHLCRAFKINNYVDRILSFFDPPPPSPCTRTYWYWIPPKHKTLPVFYSKNESKHQQIWNKSVSLKKNWLETSFKYVTK